MLLVGEHEEDGWIRSTFNLTYRVAWEQLLLAVYGAYRFFSDPEVLVDGKPVEIGDPAEILTIAEDRNIMLRGISTVITAPLMITFYNQVHFVNVSVGAVNDEFRNTDYERYNKSMCQLMDSLEIMMHLPAHPAQEATSSEEGGTGDDQPKAAQETHGEEGGEAQPADEELFASDEDAQERPVAEAQAPAEEEPAVSNTPAAQEAAPDTDEVSAEAPAGDEPSADEAQPAISNTPAAQEAAPDTDEVSAEAPAGDEPSADEAQPADEHLSPLSRLSMELGIPQPPA